MMSCRGMGDRTPNVRLHEGGYPTMSDSPLEPLSGQVDIHFIKSGSFQSEFRIKSGPVFEVGPIASALSKSGK